MKTVILSLTAITLASTLLVGCGGAPMNNAQTGAIAGSVLGGVVDHQFGGGEDGKTAATVVGAVAGGMIGGQMGATQDRAYQQPQPYYNNRPY